MNRQLNFIRANRSTSQNPKKKRKDDEHLIPLVFSDINIRHGKKRLKTIRVLLDSGASSTIVSSTLVEKLRVRKEERVDWATMNGVFSTEGRCELEFALPELNPTAVIKHNVHVTKQSSNYEMIIGCDLMTSLGINILFQDQVVTWGDGVAAMKASDCTVKTSFSIEDTARIKSKADRIKNISLTRNT